MGQSVCADIQLICEKYILSERKKKKKKRLQFNLDVSDNPDIRRGSSQWSNFSV